MSQLYIGVDIGGTKIASILADETGRIISSDRRLTQPNDGKAAVLDRIAQSIACVSAKATKQICRVGISAPGAIDGQRGFVMNAPNLQWREVPLLEILTERLGLPCVLENDANAAAIGEWYFGRNRGVKDFIYLTVSTGVGGGIFANGRLLRGRDASAGEIGHITVEPSGPRCSCGNFGCLESLASGTAMASIAKVALSNGEPSSLSELCGGNIQAVSATMIEAAASMGDQLSQRIMNQAFNYLGIGVASLVQIFNPELIVIGGGVAQVGAPLFQVVREVVNTRCFAHMRAGLPIEQPKLGGDIGVLGAVAVAVTVDQPL